MIAPSEVWRALLPPGVVAYETRRFNHAVSLLPEERDAVRNAVAKRVEEFAAGRACAHRALQDLGLQAGPLLKAADRAPVWPSGIVGSITHTDDYCVAAVARRETFVGIGIDTEAVGRMDDDVLRLVCTPDEQSWLWGMDASRRLEFATILFSAKEAFFKAQSGLDGAFGDFQDVTLRLHGDVFSVQPQRPFTPAAAIRRPLEGRYVVKAGTVFTGIAFLPA